MEVLIWTPERDHELCRLGAKAFAERYRCPPEEAQARYMVLFDPAGQAALLREKNRAIEEGQWTQPKPKPKPEPKTADGLSDLWTPLQCERLRKMCAAGLPDAVIACRLGRTQCAIKSKKRKLGLCINLEQ